MNSLITTISLALLIGRSACQSSSNLSPVGQQSANDATMNGVATPVSMNTTTTANSPNGVTSTSALNATHPKRLGCFGKHQRHFTDGEWFSGETQQSPRSIIYEQNGTVAYQITNQYAGANLTAKEFIVRDAITGEKKLKIDAVTSESLWVGQTYEADDGTSDWTPEHSSLTDAGETLLSIKLEEAADYHLRWKYSSIALMALVKTRVHACGY
ncbi:hypothetical protein H4Q26_003433 [Puccinia striiformis f. sp. tritici PST-130]|nr:hypothetical protein H4Q26_003433 [Puccinia striiformis f. sp. tritici PST-130]